VPGPLAIGIDLGGTKIAGLVVNPSEEGAIVGRALIATPAMDADASAEAVVEVVRQLAGAHPSSAAVGIGVAGLVGADGTFLFGPNLPWRNLAIGELVAARTGLPVLVDNDANVAAWGEYRFGAGKGSSHMFLATVGTGIGGGIVADGRLLRGAHGLAAEIGHIIVEPGGPLCGCGNRGCWEQVASGRAIDRLGREAAPDHPEALFVMLAGAPEKVTGPLVTEAARQGDPVAVSILEEVGRRLGEGLAGLANTLDPEVIVVGGGVVEAADLVLGPAREAFQEALEAVEYRPAIPIVAAVMGNDAGAVGAADLAAARFAGGSG